ncbi:MAG: hypothetical protein CM15mP103_09270 [Gammaproteobacteria bacterium]|nr:MAG: hypothetical protein CM15mP103_09270 [Gammaproteobacteria bacterium]
MTSESGPAPQANTRPADYERLLLPRFAGVKPTDKAATYIA